MAAIHKDPNWLAVRGATETAYPEIDRDVLNLAGRFRTGCYGPPPTLTVELLKEYYDELVKLFEEVPELKDELLVNAYAPHPPAWVYEQRAKRRHPSRGLLRLV